MRPLLLICALLAALCSIACAADLARVDNTPGGTAALPPGAEGCDIVILAADPAPPETALDAGWDWRLVPFIGGGMTFFQTKQFSLQVGFELGTFPAAFPVIGGRPFGGFLATIGDDVRAGGAGLELGTVADVPIWAGGLIWRGDSVKADFALFARQAFDVQFSW